MSNPLIKKQFVEIFRGYFVDRKTGLRRSRAKTVALFILFAFLMLIISGSFFALGMMFTGVLASDRELHWVYFAIMGIVSFALGIFGSVFNTFAFLYLAKDNDFLLSLPIPPSKILSSRMIMVYGLSLLYSGVVWLPTVILYFIFGNPAPLAVIFCIMMLFVIAAFVTAVTCALGFVVAAISVRLKNKSIVTVIISLAAMAGYYFVWFRMTDTFKSLVLNIEAAGKSIKKWGNLFWLLGRAAAGNAVEAVVFTAISLILLTLCLFIMSKSFIRIATLNIGQKKKRAKTAGAGRSRSLDRALLSRETKRFVSSPLYMLNCALGTVIAPIAAVAVLIKRNDILTVISAISGEIDTVSFLPVAIAALSVALASFNTVSTPSVSLEGNSFWLIRSLPVRAQDVLRAKRNLHILLIAPTSVISGAVTGVALGVDIASVTATAVLTAAVCCFEATAGLALGLRHSDFSWTNETVPIKQSMNMLYIMLIGFAFPVVTLGCFILLRMLVGSHIPAVAWLAALAVVIWILTYFADSAVRRSGEDKFAKL